jgi:hypothetical protein
VYFDVKITKAYRVQAMHTKLRGILDGGKDKLGKVLNADVRAFEGTDD